MIDISVKTLFFHSNLWFLLQNELMVRDRETQVLLSTVNELKVSILAVYMQIFAKSTGFRQNYGSFENMPEVIYYYHFFLLFNSLGRKKP